MCNAQWLLMASDMVLTCQIVTECLPVRLPWMYYILFAYVREKQYFCNRIYAEGGMSSLQGGLDILNSVYWRFVFDDPKTSQLFS